MRSARQPGDCVVRAKRTRFESPNCSFGGRPTVYSLAEEALSIGLTKALVRRCNLLVTTDSGPRHFAAAFDRPVITLFGPTAYRLDGNLLRPSGSPAKKGAVRSVSIACLPRGPPLHERFDAWRSFRGRQRSHGPRRRENTTAAHGEGKPTKGIVMGFVEIDPDCRRDAARSAPMCGRGLLAHTRHDSLRPPRSACFAGRTARIAIGHR